MASSSSSSSSSIPTGDPNDTIHILGLGNIGKYVAHTLRVYNPNQPITLLFHSDRMYDSWDKEGRVISLMRDENKSLQGGYQVEMLRSDPDEKQTPIRNLIVATKAYSTIDAIKPLQKRGLLDNKSTILFLQNGMGVPDLVSTKLFRDRTTRPTYYAGICSAGVYNPLQKTFGVVQVGLGPLKIGRIDVRLPNADQPPADSVLFKALSQASPVLITTLLNPNEIRIEQLRKLAVNAIINPLTAIFGCENGEVFSTHERVSLIRDLISKEIGPVLRGLLPFGTPRSQAIEFNDEGIFEAAFLVASKTARNISSMLQDCRSGRQTEIDFILGYLEKQGRHRGIETPEITKIMRHVRKLKPDNYSEPGKCLNKAGDKPICGLVWPNIDWSQEARL